MKIIPFKIVINVFVIIILLQNGLFAQSNKGKLFIIGGGERTDNLMKKMLAVSHLKSTDYIVVLPMASEEPDSSFFYFKNQIEKLTEHKIVMFNFNKSMLYKKELVDSLQKAKLIFISGGDQNRFMDVVNGTTIFTAIHLAYKNGSTIAGTSAGAAVMCEQMITGNQKLDTNYTATFNKIQYNNLETKQGLALIKNVIIDQHFLKRNRYNRLVTAMVEFPTYIGIGIDEGTAIIVHNMQIEIAGESEVVVLKNINGISKSSKNNLVGIKKLEISVYYEGQKFRL
jgi:cyanophycinase